MLRHSGHEITLLLAPDFDPVTGLAKTHLAELHKLAGALNEPLPDQRVAGRPGLAGGCAIVALPKG
jgi:hypothetical protein